MLLVQAVSAVPLCMVIENQFIAIVCYHSKSIGRLFLVTFPETCLRSVDLDQGLVKFPFATGTNFFCLPEVQLRRGFIRRLNIFLLH